MKGDDEEGLAVLTGPDGNIRTVTQGERSERWKAEEDEMAFRW